MTFKLFPFLSIVNRATMCILKKVSMDIESLYICQNVVQLSHIGNSFLASWGYSTLVSIVPAPICLPASTEWGSSSSTILPACVANFYVAFTHFYLGEMKSQTCLNLHFPDY